MDGADKRALSARTGVSSAPPPIHAWRGFLLGYWLVGQLAGWFPPFGWGHVAVYLLSSMAGIVALVLFCRVTRVIQDDQETASAQNLPSTASETAQQVQRGVSLAS